jgi:predicted nucleic acid-binding protein
LRQRSEDDLQHPVRFFRRYCLQGGGHREACRDPSDDRFLEVAISGDAKSTMTGDYDVLALHPYMEIQLNTAPQ